MRMKSCLGLALLALFGTARADVAPDPPEEPLPKSCEHLIGLWQRTEPYLGYKRSIEWQMIAVDREFARTFTFESFSGEYWAGARTFRLACEGDGAAQTITFTPTEDDGKPFSHEISKVDEKTFTYPDIQGYTGYGVDPNHVDKPITVTFKRIAP